MPRPQNCRRVKSEPETTYFKPRGIPLRELEDSTISISEFEAIRLKDYNGVEQGVAAEQMNISQPTFHRLIVSARKKIADAIINGKAIKIEGGNYTLTNKKE